MGPLEKEKIWNTDAVSECRRFLARFYDLFTSDKITDQDTKEALKLGHRLVHGVTTDIEALSFNTAIAKLMEFMNDFTKLDSYPRSVLKRAIHCLSPLAPHLAEECWELLGEKEALSFVSYPEVDSSLLEDETITYVVQVNGKLRGRFDLPKDQPEEIITKKAMEHPGIKKFVEGQEIERIIFVPNKLLNVVIK